MRGVGCLCKGEPWEYKESDDASTNAGENAYQRSTPQIEFNCWQASAEQLAAKAPVLQEERSQINFQLGNIKEFLNSVLFLEQVS
jgi:hypothetical protein